MKIINRRYRIVDLIETDSTGDVFHAVDLMNRERAVRLKLFTKEYSKSDRIKRYIDEFLSWTTINHPNICETYAFEMVRNVDNKTASRHQYFYTSEYFDASTRIEYKQLTRDEIHTAIFDMLRAVQYLHFRGMTYGYLNFDNILFLRTDKGLEVKLNDFAHVAQYKDISVYTTTELNSFMAPESIWYEQFDKSADLYSLGVLIYLIYYQGIADGGAVNRLEETVGNNPLTETLKKVTSSSAENRFTSTDAFIRKIADQLRYDYGFTDIDAYNRLYNDIELVGSRRSIDSIIQIAADRIYDKKGPLGVRINGDTGIGKSRLVSEIDYRLKIDGFEVFKHEMTKRSKEPFVAFKAILSRIIFNEKLSWELIQKYGPELVKLFPELKNRWDVQPTPTLKAEHEHLKMANRIFNFLTEYGSDRPFVLLIDNADLMSPYEHTIIDFITSVQKDIPILVICTHGHGVSEEWFGNKSVVEHELNAFNFEEGAEFVRRMLGVEKSPIEFSALLVKTFEGNARRIEEMVRTLFLEKKIYVNKSRRWQFMLPKDIQHLEASTTSEKWIESTVDDLGEEEKCVLEVISIFNEPVGTVILDNILYALKKGAPSGDMDKMVDRGILVQKLGDWGYSYDLTSMRMRSYILNNISEETRVNYHRIAAEILEDFYKDQGRHMSNQLIYHLIESRQKMRAVKYCVLAAEEMTRFNIYTQAIDFYEKALDLVDVINPVIGVASLLNQIGWLYYLLGKTTESEERYQKALEISKSLSDDVSWVDAYTNLVDIAILRGELTRPIKMLDDILNIAGKNNYLQGQLRAMKYKLKLWVRTGEYAKINEELPGFINLAIENDLPHFTGSFYNEYGVYKAKIGDYEAAENHFKIALESFRNDDDRFEEARVYNNIGVLYAEGFGDVDVSRQYYLKALSIVNDLNILATRPIYLHNIGESYLSEDRFSKALGYLNKCIQAAEEIDSQMDIYAALPLLCQTYIKMNNYERAYGIVKKMEAEFSKCDDDFTSLQNYYSVRIQFYMQVKNFEKAERILETFAETVQMSSAFQKLNHELLKFKTAWYKFNFLKLNKSVEVNEIKEIVDRIENYHLAHDAREILLDICLELCNSKKYVYMNMLLDLDQGLSKYFNSDHLACKRDLLKIMLSDERIDGISKLIKEDNEVMSKEWQWFAYKALGDEYFVSGDSYLALTNYLMALDIIKTLTFSIPDGQRENYILYDEAKIDLKARINAIRRRIDMNSTSDEKLFMHELETLSVDDYFDLSAIKSLYYNESFLKKIYSLYDQKFSMNLSTLENLVSQLRRDESENIRYTLIHCLQMAIADSGCVLITDSQSRIVETITSDDRFVVPDVKRLIAQIGPERKGLLINSFEGDGLSYLLAEHQKAVILLPIVSKDKDETLKRRIDDEEEAHIQGYVYLESNQVFNRFNKEIFDKLGKLTSLFSLVIDNLNIKKISSIDELTDVYLRKYIEDKFSVQLNQARHNNDRLSVIMCDIDKFKTVNDRYGHRRGDEILKQIGYQLKISLRETDLVGRYGGEEFIIILPNTGDEEAVVVSEKIRKNIESSISINEDEPITLSLGVSTYPDHGLNEEELIEKADQALYHSKNSGRNRTTLWNAFIGEEKSRFDKLAGILTGNISNDTRNIQAIMDILDLLRLGGPKDEKLYSVLTTLIDITQATKGAILEIADDEIVHVYAREKGYDEWQPFELDMELIENYMERDAGDYFINWNKVAEINSMGGKPNWKSMIVMPLRDLNQTKGMIILSVPISIKEFDFSAYNFVDSVSGVVMKIIG